MSLLQLILSGQVHDLTLDLRNIGNAQGQRSNSSSSQQYPPPWSWWIESSSVYAQVTRNVNLYMLGGSKRSGRDRRWRQSLSDTARVIANGLTWG